jgi:hypothetical protein
MLHPAVDVPRLTRSTYNSLQGLLVCHWNLFYLLRKINLCDVWMTVVWILMLSEHVLDSVLGGGPALLCLDKTNIGHHEWCVLTSIWLYYGDVLSLFLKLTIVACFRIGALVVICCFTCSYWVEESFNTFARLFMVVCYYLLFQQVMHYILGHCLSLVLSVLLFYLCTLYSSGICRDKLMTYTWSHEIGIYPGTYALLF